MSELLIIYYVEVRSINIALVVILLLITRLLNLFVYCKKILCYCTPIPVFIDIVGLHFIQTFHFILICLYLNST